MSFPDRIPQGEFIIAEWLAAVLRAADDPLAAEFGITVRQAGSITALSARKVPHPFVNHIIGLGVDVPATEAQINDLIGRYPAGNFALSPAALPSQIPDWLAERGFIAIATLSIMRYAGGAPEPPETRLRIEEIDPSRATAFATILGTLGVPGELAGAAGVEPERFLPWFAALVGEPGWRHYLAYNGEIPAATGATFIKGKTAWVCFAATHPEHRRLGAQSALIARRVRDALAMGCSDIFAGTITAVANAEAGHHRTSNENLVRCGFEPAYQDRILGRVGE